MSRLFVTPLLLLLLTVPASVAAADNETITQDELVRRTQELLDAVAPGDQRPWREYYADDAMFFDERGRSMDKTALVADITPLPKGYSGNIKVLKPQSRIIGNTAILSYDLDESETVYGQEQKARYHGTDTWLYRDGKWQIVATQMFRYYEDPAPGKIDLSRLNDYVGTYEVTPGITITVSRDGDKLYSKREKRPQHLLVPETCDLFFRPGVEGRVLFRRNDSGKVDALVDRRNNEDVVWKKM
jgi:hypothetical protein